MRKKGGGTLGKFGSAIKRADPFGQGVTFRIDGSDQKRSILGALVGLLIFLVVLIQLNEKWAILVNRSDTSHTSFEESLPKE